MSLNKKKNNKKVFPNPPKNKNINPSEILEKFDLSSPSFLENMEKLVSNDKEKRESALVETKKYLLKSYSNNEELYQNISRSLFYFFF